MTEPIGDEEAKDWNSLKPLEPTAAEKQTIDALLNYNPKLDYLMALLLVKSKEEDLQRIIETKKSRPDPPTSTIIKDAFYIDNDEL